MTNTTLSAMDMVAYRYVIPGSVSAVFPEGEFVQDVVYNNSISESELRQWIAYRHKHNPIDIEVAR